jgi:hypothetical protein
VHLEETSAKVLLGQRVAEGINDSRALAASVVFTMPDGVRDVRVQEFLGWIQGSNEALVAEYEHAAMIARETRLGDLRPFQRAALIGALRLRRKIDRI